MPFAIRSANRQLQTKLRLAHVSGASLALAAYKLEATRLHQDGRGARRPPQRGVAEHPAANGRARPVAANGKAAPSTANGKAARAGRREPLLKCCIFAMSGSRASYGPSDPGPRGRRRAWAELLGRGARGPREWAALGSETTSRSSLGRPDPGRPGSSACRLPSARWAPTPDPPNSGPRTLLVPSTSCPQALLSSRSSSLSPPRPLPASLFLKHKVEKDCSAK